MARVLDRGGALFCGLGMAPDYMVTLEVPGRRTGRIVRLPLVMVARDGKRYLVSMLGEHVNWVLNVKAADGRVTLRHGRSENVRLEEVAPEHRAPVLRDYLRRAPRAGAHIPVETDGPLSEFERVSARYPVFEVVSVRVA